VAYSWWGKVTGVYLIESQRNDQILTNGGDLEPKNLTGLSPPKLKLTSLILYGIAWDLSNVVAKPWLQLLLRYRVGKSSVLSSCLEVKRMIHICS
jgi:hypothetical protein